MTQTIEEYYFSVRKKEFAEFVDKWNSYIENEISLKDVKDFLMSQFDNSPVGAWYYHDEEGLCKTDRDLSRDSYSELVSDVLDQTGRGENGRNCTYGSNSMLRTFFEDVIDNEDVDSILASVKWPGKSTVVTGLNKEELSFMNKEELSFIKGRMEIERDWGESVYTKESIDMMTSIICKIENTLNRE